MFKKVVTLVTLVAVMVFFAGCGNSTETPNQDVSYETKAVELTNKLVSKDYEGVVLEFDDKMKKALPATELQKTWDAALDGVGNFISIEKTEINNKNNFQTVLVYSKFENKGIVVSVTFDINASKVAGLYINYYNPTDKEANLPEGLEEKEVTIGENTQFPLAGKITCQKGQKSDTAVLLVHGSGPQDMDETIYQNKPFKDIAWGLAAKGIDVLRYDKRTYTYSTTLSQSDYTTFTAYDETIEDAVLAAKLLQQQGYKNIYIGGHSFVGMLAMQIDKQSDGLFTGIISLAGSPRSLVDIIIDQNNKAIASLTDNMQIAVNQKLVDTEKEKLAKLQSWNDEELKQNTVFGLPAYYVKDLLSQDTSVLAKEYKKPILVLQGKEDFQVYPDVDFTAWKEVLSDNKNAEFILYDNLNHIFMPSATEGKGTVEEYKTPNHVEQKVIDDMAAFINKYNGK